MTRMTFVLYLVLVLACQPAPVTNPGALGTWPVDEYREIPFTVFDTQDHKIKLEFLADKLQSRLNVNNAVQIVFPERVLPLKALDLVDNRLLVISKDLFSGDLSIFIFRADGSGFTEVDLLSSLAYSLFKQAIIFDDQLMIILYNVETLENNLYRWEITDNGTPIVDENDYWHLKFNGRYEVDANIFMAIFQDRLYFVGEGVRYLFTKDGILSRTELSGNLSVVEMSLSSQGLVGVFQDESLLTTPLTSTSELNVFQIINLEPDTPVEILTDLMYKIPFHLRFDNGWMASDVTTPDALTAMLEFDLKHRSPSGIYNLGDNNLEGRVAWSQVYYLNGFIDLVKEWENEKVDFRFLGDLKQDLKLRLDLEMYLLDRLLDSENPGLHSSRYSVDRLPVIHAVQTGRILRLIKRYVLEVANPLKLVNYDKFLDHTQYLRDHIEVLVSADESYPDVTPGRYLIKWPKGSAFWSDGVAVPYNMQDDWAGGVAYAAKETEAQATYLIAAKDIVTTFLTNEQFYLTPPADYQWRYNWGWAWLGWTRDDNISVNTPTYSGDHSMAHISYRTIDVMAVLSVGRIFPEVLPDGFMAYVAEAVQKNGIYPFATEELLKAGIHPILPSELATMYVRVKSPWELQNSAWAILSLYNQLGE